MNLRAVFPIISMLIFALIASITSTKALAATSAEMAALSNYINTNYPAQLTNPQKKKRHSLSQFGYGLSFFAIPVYDISEFIDPKDFGEHSFGEPNSSENNGALYTCNGGFIDFSHLRAGLDWSVYLTFQLLGKPDTLSLEPEEASLKLRFKNLNQLSLDEIASIGQKVAYERLIWHEIASWSYHAPNFFISEQQSTFTPEDVYSNLLGTLIGKKVALRILTNKENLPFSQIANEEIREMIRQLLPLQNEDASKQAYDIVDRHVQAQLPVKDRNKDIWWDSKIIFTDARYVFKRYMNIGPAIAPWLVPNEYEKLGCPCEPFVKTLKVPTNNKSGASLYNYYSFTISPDSILFFAEKSGKELHKPFKAFTTQNIAPIMKLIGLDMQKMLSTGFDKRNSLDPVPNYENVKNVLF
jgi:hypothetical protein